MEKYILGIDVGSISTKGVIINYNGKIIESEYLWTEGNPMNAVKRLINSLRNKLKTRIVINKIGVTGSARKLVGNMLNATIVKNEITAHAIGTCFYYPDVKTILEIGGQDSKIITVEDGIITDYAMNTLCAAGTGSFLTSQAKRLGIDINDFGRVALQSKNPAKIAARCTVFAESDLVHKLQAGYSKQDIVSGLCNAVVNNYLNNVGKGKKIKSPIVFQGGVSKNIGVVKAFEKALGSEIFVHEYGHLMGALGIAILASKNAKTCNFDFDPKAIDFRTSCVECNHCSNHCDVIFAYRNKELIDVWGNRCENGKTVQKQIVI